MARRVGEQGSAHTHVAALLEPDTHVSSIPHPHIGPRCELSAQCPHRHHFSSEESQTIIVIVIGIAVIIIVNVMQIAGKLEL